MNSVFDTDKFISSFYDLKGSITGRDAKPGEYVKKDNDIRKQLPSAALNFDPTVKERLRAQIMEDCNFLKSMKIMDYSMLVGVHRIPQSKHGQEQFNESFLTDHESSKSLLLEDNACSGSFSPIEVYSSPTSNRKVFRSGIKPDLESCASEKSVFDPKTTSSSHEDRHTAHAHVHLESPKNSGNSIDRFLETVSPSRSFSCSEEVVCEDDDYSYLEDCSSPLLHSDQRYSDETKLDLGQFESGNGSVKDYPCTSSEILNNEVSTEQFYWPFHRFFNNKGERRLQLSPYLVEDDVGKNANVEFTSLIKELPLFIKPISNRKDKGLLSTSVSSSEHLVDGEVDKPVQVNHEIFYMGIIDVLQQFNLRKRIEAQMRIYQGDGWQDASCVHPDLYASRFLQFFDEITLTKRSMEPSGLVSMKVEYDSNSDVSHEEISFAMVDGNT
jgi:1-phosphatidylinositol-4-phosphate 5-kinase